jgi:hypothetical protein
MSDKAKTTKASGEQYVSLVCDRCQKKVGATVGHYGLLVCVCGKTYWALRPQRNGPLVAYPHPGFVATLERMAA